MYTLTVLYAAEIFYKDLNIFSINTLVETSSQHKFKICIFIPCVNEMKREIGCFERNRKYMYIAEYARRVPLRNISTECITYLMQCVTK